jgi:lipopolysaccharide transport system ATP-binding protein
VKRYSSGMYVRLAFSVAAHLESEILLIDEVLAVGDVSFQRKCLGKMKDVGSSGRTVLFVSHNMAAVEKLCTRTVVLKNGRLDFDGDVREGVAHYFSSFEKTTHEGLDVSRRTGNGRARVVEAWTTDGDGAPMHIARSGQEVRFHVRVRPHHQCKDVLLALGITTLSDEGILHMSTETGGFEIERIDNDMIFTCKIDRLPLRAGLYAINIYMASGGSVLDYLIDAIRFQVEDADFYGTGKLPPHEGYPHFLVDFSWSSTSAS